MPLKAIFLGSLGALADTSELQRRAYNAAFAEAGLDWDWPVEIWRALGAQPSSVERIARHARSRGEIVDARALDRRGAEILLGFLSAVVVPPRPGLTGLIRAARGAGLRLALVTTSPPETVDAMLAVTGLDRGTFDFVGDATMSSAAPACGIYRRALAALDLRPDQVLAIEQTPERAAAAGGAGINCVSFPGASRLGGAPLARIVAARTAAPPQPRIARSA